MKSLTVFVSFFIISQFSIICEAQDSSLPDELTVLGQSVVIKENKGNAKLGFIAEYIPEDETFDNWTLMFATRFSPGTGKGTDPRALAQATADDIAARKKDGDSLANSLILESPDKKSVVLDFLVSDKAFIEHNFWRFFRTDSGLVSFQIARRIYAQSAHQKQTTEFISSIQTLRPKLLTEIMRAELPMTSFAE